MTQKPEETIARLLELSEKITKGEWGKQLHTEYGVVCGRQRGICSTAGYSDNAIDAEILHLENVSNADFIAQAANSIPAIRQLLATMAVMGGALEDLTNGGMFGGYLDDPTDAECFPLAAKAILDGRASLAAYAPFKALVARLDTSEQLNRSSEATDGLAEKVGGE